MIIWSISLVARGGLGWGQDVQVSEVLLVFSDVLFSQVMRINSKLISAVDDFVIHISEIHDVMDIIALKGQITPNDIENQSGHGVPDMSAVIDSDATNIHADFTGFNGLKLGLIPGQGVIYS